MQIDFAVAFCTAQCVHLLQPGVELPEVASHSNWPVSNGIFTYPGKNGNLTVPANGTVYLNISASSCWLPSNAANPLPNARVLKKHYYFGFRPALTWLYGEFDSREWAAHLGMGNETHGLALAGKPLSLPSHLSTQLFRECVNGQIL